MFTTRPEIEGTFGVVASTHWLATAVGMRILEHGGNAFDAGVAAAFTLQVVDPHLNGPGGEAPILVYDRRRAAIEVICGQGPAPGAATIPQLNSLGLNLIPGTGLLPACVPGALDALLLVLERYGTLFLRDVLAPAIAYAKRGFPLVPGAVAAIAQTAEIFARDWPSSAEVYLPRGKPPSPNSLFSNVRLGETYERIVTLAERASAEREAQIAHARLTWSQGFVAEAIDRYCRTEQVPDVTGRPHGGLLTGEDMSRWTAAVEQPTLLDYGRYTVAKCGPWTQGPVMLQTLSLLDGLLPDGPFYTDLDLVELIHLQVEAAKLALADRDTFYGDPQFVDVPLTTLLSASYAAERRGLITEAASIEFRPGIIHGYGKRMAFETGPGGAVGAGEPSAGHAEPPTGDTVHFDVVDCHGNMISGTPSGGWLQSSPVIPALGFCLGTRAQMFVLDDEHPAALSPGKRPRTTLSPTIALRDGVPYLAWGSPGGDQQDQWATQLFLRHVHGHHNLQEAIDAPAWHTDHVYNSFWPRRPPRLGHLAVEGRLSDTTLAELRRRGHDLEVVGPWSEGRLTAVSQDGERRKAAANPRGMQGYAAGR